MADINCPICNRMNNSEAERCWYCQAVLHPEQKNADSGGDWLDGLRDSGSGAQGQSQPPPGDSNNSPDEVPDWLARIRQREQMEHVDEPAGDGANKDAIDWLRDSVGDDRGSTGELPPAQSGPADSASEGDDADWLGKLESWQSTGQEQLDSSRSTQPSAEPAAPEPNLSVSTPTSPSSEPDWLKEFQVDANPVEPLEPEKPVEAAPLQTSAIDEPISPAADSQAAEEPVNVEESPQVAAPNGSTPASAEPDWLADFQTLDPGKDLTDQVLPKQEEPAAVKPPFSGRDMMNWISKDQAEPLPEKLEEPSPVGEDIAPASLPPWLQALRPNKGKAGSSAGKTGSTDENVKSPLAGIDGVLGDTLNQFYTRPKTYANTLKITPEQESHLQRLQNIAGEARWEAKEAAEPKGSRNGILKALVAILFITGILVTTFTHKTALAAPTVYAQPVVETYDTISALGADKPVLVAADFDSSLYGELKWSSSSILQQLMKQDVPIAYLSTTPVGTTLFGDLLNEQSEIQTGYSLADRTVNLGYLPGGTVGLQALAQDPRSTLNLTTNLEKAWEGTPLESVNQISNFAAVIVITENADTARYWIEQVKPSLGDTPLLVVISAQSAPMLQPYYDSGQVDGYLAGISGSAAFESLSGVTGVANEHYAVYQVTLLITTIIILIGGLISLIVRTPSAERSRQEPK
jgi:hypothetical protein